ncbi:Ger(x)C family spore germination protein [Paenibacillus qinlingensis]|uniref:Ger(x)C family spore germination protein n=1 Tax=Paenibacillus qinlingensis TaxID=1837343 RepID=UPI0015661B28|nr:Ger(x)C family spore germination protein [Paenibacillus qinlingensis]NQX64037.1 Ger(x)C family spore germination protein [Paenibacillus qinlingensis]
MKTYLRLGLLCLTLVCLTGCWDRMEVNDLGIITAIGVDKNQDNEGVVVSVQVFVPSSNNTSIGGMEGNKAKSPVSIVVSAAGVNMSDANQRLQEKLSRKLFWGHASTIVFGEELARYSLEDPLAFLRRHPGPRGRSLIFVCQGNAVDMLSANPVLERDTSEELREMSNLHTGLYVTLLKLHNLLESDSKSYALPYTKMYTSQKQKNKAIYVYGSALLKKNQMVGLLDDSSTRGFMWLTNTIKSALITVDFNQNQGKVSVDVFHSHSSIEPFIEGENLSVKVKTLIECNVVENTTKLNMLEEKSANIVESKIAKILEERILSVVTQSQNEFHVDALGFATAFHRKYPQQWKILGPKWDTLFPQIIVSVETDINLERTGFIEDPISKKMGSKEE